MENNKMLYFGSCRYMYDFQWNSFLGRLHTTREIGATISVIGDVLEDRYPKPILTYLFGDLGHPGVGYGYNGTGLVRDQDLKSVKDIIIEVSSNIVQKFHINNQPVYGNTHYLKRDNHMKDTYTGSETITLSPQDIERDIGLINTLIKGKFHHEATLHVIPPLNLKLNNTDYIESRVINTRALEEACIQHKVNFCNIGKHLEDACKTPTLERFLPTGAHYDKALFEEYVKPYLEEQIRPL
jgi:hypothetical protein|tara:strand:- start:1878 stop:2597 length:720 start_codon:yes stop_codon:yes gene_type:complete